MNRIRKPARLLLVALAAAILGAAQNADISKEPPMRFYKLDFVVKDVDGDKVVLSRNYTVITSTKISSARIHTSSLIKTQQPANADQRIGTDIECKNFNEADSALSFEVSASVTGLLGDSQPNPVVRENQWSSMVTVPLKKPTVIFSSDDNTTNRVMLVVVTATLLKP